MHHRPNKYRDLLKIAVAFCVAIFLVVSSSIAINPSNTSASNNPRPGANVSVVAAGNFLHPASYIKDPKQKIPNLKWLELSPEVFRDWNVNPAFNNPSTLLISPKWQSPGKTTKSILGLIPIKSEVFGVSLSTTLSLFKQRDVPAIFTIVNYGKIDDFGRALLNKAKREKADMILTIGSVATELVHKYFRGERIPVVTSASKDPVLAGQIADYKKGSGDNVVFTSISPPFEVFQTYLLQLRPSLKNVAILYESFNVSAVQTQVKPMEKIAKEKEICPLLFAVHSADTAKQELAKMLPVAVAEMAKTDPTLENSIFLVTGSASVYRETALINKFGRNIPAIATLPNVVKEGADSATLAIGAQMQNVAYIASLYAIDILNGRARPGDLPVGVVSPPDIAISFLRTQKIGLKVPFNFFEQASFVYNYEGKTVRSFGQNVVKDKT